MSMKQNWRDWPSSVVSKGEMKPLQGRLCPLTAVQGIVAHHIGTRMHKFHDSDFFKPGCSFAVQVADQVDICAKGRAVMPFKACCFCLRSLIRAGKYVSHMIGFGTKKRQSEFKLIILPPYALSLRKTLHLCAEMAAGIKEIVPPFLAFNSPKFSD